MGIIRKMGFGTVRLFVCAQADAAPALLPGAGSELLVGEAEAKPLVELVPAEWLLAGGGAPGVVALAQGGARRERGGDRDAALGQEVPQMVLFDAVRGGGAVDVGRGAEAV